jgi:hypothetical protein
MPYKDPEKNRLSKQAFYRKERDAKRAARATYEAEHPEETLEKCAEEWVAKAVRHANSVWKRFVYHCTWQAEHVEHMTSYRQRYYRENKAAVTKRNLAYYAAHRQEIAAYKQRWFALHQVAVKHSAAYRYLLNRAQRIANAVA